MVEALCRHVSDDSPTVRRLCLRGLVQVRVYSVSATLEAKFIIREMHNLVALGFCQMPSACMNHYTTQVIGVILALLDDLDESVQLTAVSCLLMVTTQYLCTVYVRDLYAICLNSYVLVFFCIGHRVSI